MEMLSSTFNFPLGFFYRSKCFSFRNADMVKIATGFWKPFNFFSIKQKIVRMQFTKFSLICIMFILFWLPSWLLLMGFWYSVLNVDAKDKKRWLLFKKKKANLFLSFKLVEISEFITCLGQVNGHILLVLTKFTCPKIC